MTLDANYNQCVNYLKRQLQAILESREARSERRHDRMEGYKSEVAYFREQQALREEAAERGLSGFAAAASHESITARMERGAERILRLIQQGRHEEALALMNSDAWYAEAEGMGAEGEGRQIS